MVFDMRFAFLLFLWLAGPADAHEFWIEPSDYQPGATIEARLVNGQGFTGAVIAYFPNRFARFTLALGDEEVPVGARAGDNPALVAPPLGEGLHVATYVSSGDIVTYDNYAVFARFVEHKDFPGHIHRQHQARGLPEDRFSEYYTRFCKSLIGVGSSAGADRALGLEIELVALANPYVDDLSAGLPVQAFYQGAPLPDWQIELFDKAPDGTVTITTARTDADGIGLLQVTPGHSYLVDAVYLREPSAALQADRGVVWESLWASLTFAVPDP
jgi:hypothetical protein